MSKETTITPFAGALKAAGATSFAVIAPGDQITEGGFLVNEEGLNGIESELTAGATAASELATATQTIAARDSRIVELEAANATLTGRVTELENAQTEAANETITGLQEQLTSLTTERDSLRADAEKWRKSASGSGTTVTTDAAGEANTNSGGAKAGWPSWRVADGSEELAARYEK